MPEWRPTKLGELIEIKHGFAFKGEYFVDELPGDFLLTPGNFAIGGGFQWGKRKYYREGPIPEEFILSPGDLLVTMTDLSKEADTLGYSALVPQADCRFLHNQRLGKVILKSDLVNKSFLMWLLRSPSYRNEILANYTGSTVKHTSPTKIRAFEFHLPPPDEQRSIADVLDSLDDKIELNRRMNETLEAMARAIFRDWFVDFGPNRAKQEAGSDRAATGKENGAGREPYLAPDLWALFPDRLDDDGKPEGWIAGALSDIAEAPRRGISPAQVDAETPYIGLEHMPRRSVALSEWENADKVTSNKSTFQKGELLFGKLRPYFHKVGIAPVDGICSTDIVVVRPTQPLWSAFVLTCLSSDDFVGYTDRASTGTKMPRTSWKIMGRYPLCLPPEPVARAFEDFVQPLTQRIVANIHENRTLAATTDLLLPRLMSGEIRAAEAEGLADEMVAGGAPRLEAEASP